MTRIFNPTEDELIRMARELAQRERHPYDQITLPLVLERLADTLEAYRNRALAERATIATRLQTAQDMREGRG